jgi:hypothetical protein
MITCQADKGEDMLNPLWTGSRALTWTGLLMIGVLAATLVGLLLDPRVVTGAPAWLKPAKFAASIAIYSLTLAWVFSLIPAWVRTRRFVGRVTASVLILEMAIIAFQAARGTTSHFNVGTPFDTVLFGVMGLAIVMQTLTSVAVAVALWRHAFADRAFGWALRLGMTVTIVGAMTGGLMTRPTPQQLEAARAGERMTIAGAHTVGARDCGPGLPGTGWSTTHGDVRVAHFLGLHALQVLPLAAVALRRRKVSDALRVRLVLVAAGSYAALFFILLTQALRGQSVIAPDGLTLILLAAWVTSTLFIAFASIVRAQPVQRAALV